MDPGGFDHDMFALANQRTCVDERRAEDLRPRRRALDCLAHVVQGEVERCVRQLLRNIGQQRVHLAVRGVPAGEGGCEFHPDMGQLETHQPTCIDRHKMMGRQCMRSWMR